MPFDVLSRRSWERTQTTTLRINNLPTNSSEFRTPFNFEWMRISENPMLISFDMANQSTYSPWLDITLLLVCWKVHEFTWGFLCYGGSQKPPLVFESAWDFQVKIQFAATSSNFPHFRAHAPIHSQKLWCWESIGFSHFATVDSTFDHPVAGSPELWHSISDLGIFNLDIPSM